MGPRHLQTLVLSTGLILTGNAFAQNDQPHPWRPADGAYAQQTQPDIAPDPNQPPAPPAQLPSPYTPLPPSNQGANYGNQGANYGNQGANYGNYSNAVPPRLTIKPGTYVIIRTAEVLSSDHSAPGQTFVATLAEPVIVDGVVVAQRGQTVYGRVTEAQRAGRVEGVSKLGIELTGITTADGQQLSVQSEMLGHVGPTSQGRDAAAIAGTAGLGAAIGAAVGWGTGAAIGAGAGAVAGLAGVLLTRGEPTVIPPESMLTFRIQQPVEIATDRAPQAFHYVGSQDYAQNNAPPQGYAQRPPAPRGYAAPGYPSPYAVAAPPPAYYGPAYYPYPYYGAPGFSVVIGPRYGYYGGYYRGYRRW